MGSAVGPRAPPGPGPGPAAPGASRRESQQATPTGLPGESRPARPGPPPPPARALKDILLFLPRTKDNKRSRGTTHRVRARLSAPPGRLHPRSAPGRPPEPPARARSSRRGPGEPPRPLPQRRFRRRGPGRPGSLCRGLRHPRAARLASAATASLPRAYGPPGHSFPPAGGPRGRDGAPDSSGCCCLSGHLVPCVCGVSLPSPLSALLPPPPPPAPHTTQHGLFAAAAAAAAAAASAALLPAPLPHPPRLPPAAPRPSAQARRRPPASAIGCESFLPPLPGSGLTHARRRLLPS